MFSVEMHAPWKFMEFSPEVNERIAAAARGEVLPVQPVRAGDDVPSRSFVRSRKDILSEDLHCSVDFSQYGPFRTAGEGEVSFRVSVDSLHDDFSLSETGTRLLWDFTEDVPSYSVYEVKGGILFRFHGPDGKNLGMVTGAGQEYTVLLPEPDDRRYHYPLILNSAMMMIFLMAASREHILLVHSSVISHGGEANMFFGDSGTGKSTHSRLWLENIDGSELLNDDNPVIVLEDGIPYVCGTPWSGKTPCYRNVRQKIRSLVFLKQAPVNSITPLGGVMSFMKMLGCVSSPAWDSDISERINDDVATLLSSVPVWLLECLPDAGAALVCHSVIE